MALSRPPLNIDLSHLSRLPKEFGAVEMIDTALTILASAKMFSQKEKFQRHVRKQRAV